MYDSQNLNGFSRMNEDDIYTKFDRSGFYRAKVISNNDPLNLGRVKIRIPSLHGISERQTFYVPDAHLPYAYPGIMDVATNHIGKYMIPIEGSLVWISFEAGTENFIYFGGIYCIKPNNDKYIYFNRNINNGESKKIDTDDIEADNDPHRYVLFKSIKGATIYIDDRDATECIHIEDRFGNSINMNSSGTTINSRTPLKANYPYLITYYMDVDLVSDDVIFNTPESNIYTSKELENNVDKIIVGAKVVYLSKGVIAGSGFITDINSNFTVTISTNALMCHKCRLETDGDYLMLYNDEDKFIKDKDELIIHGTDVDEVIETEGIDLETGKDKDQLIIDD